MVILYCLSANQRETLFDLAFNGFFRFETSNPTKGSEKETENYSLLSKVDIMQMIKFYALRETLKLLAKFNSGLFLSHKSFITFFFCGNWNVLISYGFAP